MNSPYSVMFIFLWSTLDSVIHLGNYLMMNLSVDLDIQMKTMDGPWMAQ